MFPTPFVLFTVSTPSATIHCAGDLSRLDTHSSRFLPSKSTIASEGGAVVVAPGVTTLGTGSHISVSSCFIPPGEGGSCGDGGAAAAIRAVNAKHCKN